jgi:hypothetical protein
MKQKIYLILGILIILGLPMINAVETLGNVKQNDVISLYQYCDSCTYVNLTSVKYPNETIINFNAIMTKSGTNYNYTWNDTSELGSYFYTVCGDKDGELACEDTQFEVTYIGKQLSGARAGLYIGFLALLILIFILNFYGMGFLPNDNSRDEEGRIMSISYLKYFRNVLWMTGYFLFIGILYIASNIAFAFLEEELIAKTMFMIFRISFIIAPIIIIVWMIFIFTSMYHDKEFQNMLNRGIFPGGRL